LLDLLVPLWIFIIGLVIPPLALFVAIRSVDYRSVTRISGLITMGLGFAVVLAMPFIPFGRNTYLRRDASGEMVEVSEFMFLWNTAGSQLPVVLGISLAPVLVIGIAATAISPRGPIVAAGVLWLAVIAMLVWTVTLYMGPAWIYFPLTIPAAVTAIFATLSIRERLERECLERHHKSVLESN
jgi:hypothetical protein